MFLSSQKFILSFLVFTFSFYLLKAQVSGPEQDCSNAISVCQDIYVQNESYEGFGDMQEILIQNTSCLLNGENNSVWYIFTVTGSGDLEFSIIPFANDDYDFALYDLTGLSCSDILTGVAPEVRCNYSGTLGPTGLQSGFTGISEGAGGPPFSAPLPVNVGETYALVIDNFTSSDDGYTLDFTASSAQILDNVPPELANVNTSGCDESFFLEVILSEPVLCSSIDPDGTNFSLSGPDNLNILSASSDDCDAGGAFTSIIVLELDQYIINGGAYTLDLHGSDNGTFLEDNCGNIAISDQLVFQANNIIIPDIEYEISTGCSNDTVTIINNTEGNVTDIIWNFGNGMTSSDFAPEITVLSGGVLNVTVEMESSDCVVQESFTVQLSDGFNAAFTSLTSPICANEDIEFEITTPAFADNYNWIFPDGVTYDIENPVHSFAEAGTYSISLTIANSFEGCTETVLQDVVVNPRPNAIINVPSILCSGEVIVLDESSIGNISAYTWNTGDGNTYETANPQHVYETEGTFDISLFVSDGICGTDSTVTTITVNQSPEFSLGADTSICFSETLVIEPDFPPDFDSFQWSTGQDNVTSIEVSTTPEIVWLEITADGCTRRDSLEVTSGTDECPLPISIPNAFTPNESGINDVFRPVAKNVETFEMQIFNRWGQKLFSTNVINNGWDGTFNNADQPMGVYVYDIRIRFLDGRDEYFTGNLHLIR